MTQDKYFCKECGKWFTEGGYESHDGGFVCGEECAEKRKAWERYWKPIKREAGQQTLFEQAGK